MGSYFKGPISEAVGMLFVFVVITIVVSLFSFICYKIAKFIHKKSKVHLSKEDFIKSKQYFREILSTYSPTVLSYIDNLKSEQCKDLVAILLSLQAKNKIQFDETNNTIIKCGNGTEGLFPEEILVLNSITNGKCKRKTEIKSVIEDESTKQGVIKFVNTTINSEGTLGGVMILSMPMTLGSTVITTALAVSGYAPWIYAIISFVIFVTSFVFVWRIDMETKNIYRTKKGKEINKKIEGLKVFLKDFSTLDTATTNEIILWEDYLIYSVIFGQNKKIVDEIWEKYCI